MISVKNILILAMMILVFACGESKTQEAKPAEEIKSMVEKEEPKETETKVEETEPEVEEASGSEEAPKSEESSEPAMTPEQLEKASSLISSTDASLVEAVDAKKLFRMHCAICHGFKGNMMVNGAKDLTKSTIELKNAVAQVYFGKGLMTPYKDVLKEEEIIALAKYTETLR